jgi:hypothetical protein
MKDVLTIVVSIISTVLVFVFVLVFPVKMLWNSFMVDIFSLPKITFFQALQLLFLTGFLFQSGSLFQRNNNKK